MWMWGHPYCEPNLHHNKHTFVCFHKQHHNPQYWDTGFGRHYFRNALNPYCLCQFFGYDKGAFQNASNTSCSCWNLCYGLHFFQMHLALIMAYIFVRMHLVPHVLFKTFMTKFFAMKTFHVFLCFWSKIRKMWRHFLFLSPYLLVKFLMSTFYIC